MACEQGDLQEVGIPGARRKVPHLHVLDHALPKDGHGKLLCEMECAALSAPPCRNPSLSMMRGAYDDQINQSRLSPHAPSHPTAKRFSRVPSMLDSLGVEVPYP